MSNWRGNGKAPLRAAEYDRLRETIAAGRSGTSRTIGNNTVARLDDSAQCAACRHGEGTCEASGTCPEPDVVIRLHATDIVRLKPDGSATFNAGGWRTSTTKERMNEVLRTYGAGISQDRGAWTLWTHYGDGRKPYGFRDGITVRRLKNGKVRVSGYEPNGAERTKRRRAKIRKFATEYVRRLRARELPAPGGGDCMICMMGSARDCIESHIGESYYVPRLMTNAMADGGFAPVMTWAVASAWGALKNEKGETTDYPGADWEWSMIRRRFTRWLMRKMGEVS